MKKRSFRIIAFTGLITIAIATTTYIIISNQKDSINEEKKVLLGKKHLKQLEEMELSVVEEKIDKHNTPDTPEVVIENKDIDFYNFYENTVFMGDSITEGLIDMNLVNEYNVISNKGDTVVKGRKNIDKLTSLQPKNVVMLYGMNDVIEFTGSPDQFKSNYTEFVNEVKTKLPNANIYIQAPLPVMEKAKETNERLTNDNLDEFRKIAYEVSQETGVNYVNIDVLTKDKDELHEGDGIHFKYDFYLKWLAYLHQAIISNN